MNTSNAMRDDGKNAMHQYNISSHKFLHNDVQRIKLLFNS